LRDGHTPQTRVIVGSYFENAKNVVPQNCPLLLDI
jgi:hypothetical protein